MSLFYRENQSYCGRFQTKCRRVLIYSALVYGNDYIEHEEAQYIKKQEEWERKKLKKVEKKFVFF